LGVEQGASVLAVDAAGESGDEGFAVLGDDEGVAFGELADFGAGEDGDVLTGDGAVGASGLPGGAGDPDGAEEVGDLLVERDVLGPAEQDQGVGQAEDGAGLVFAEDLGELGPGLGGPDERDPEGAFVGHPGLQGG
jgi:hypothetical protein